MKYRIMIENTLYTTEQYDDDGVFICFKDKYGKEVKINKTSIKYIRECD